MASCSSRLGQGQSAVVLKEWHWREGPVNPEIGAPRTGPPPRSLRTSLSTDCPLEPKVLKPPDSLIGKAQILRESITRFPLGWLPGLYPRGGCTR